MEFADEHEEISAIMTIFPKMVVEEAEPPVVMEASPMLLECSVLKEGYW